MENNGTIKINSYKDLEVWKKSILLVTDIYKISQAFPKEEIYGITSQIRRASTSIPANIAEGSARKSTKTYMQFINIALGSRAELDTFFIIANNLGYLSKDNLIELTKQIDEIGRMLNGLRNSLQNSLLNNPEA